MARHVFFALTLGILTGTANAQTCGWRYGPDQGLPGTDGIVYASTVYDDGAGPALYVGGEFSAAGGVACNRIARWSGSAWQPLGTGIGDSSSFAIVSALTVYHGELIAGGTFTTAGGVSCNGIARWDGSAWAPLGAGADGSVHALTTYEGELIAGGVFGNADGVSCINIARWDGNRWERLGEGLGIVSDFDDPIVNALTVYNGDLVAGGSFVNSGGVECRRIARWNGSAWSSLGSGMEGGKSMYNPARVRALLVRNGELIAGGGFGSAGGVPCTNIARWDGSAWQPMGEGVDQTPWADWDGVFGLTIYRGEVMAGGFFDHTGDVPCNNIARWHSGAWQSLGSGILGTVHALVVYDDELIAGGSFSGTGGLACSHIARWDSDAWHMMGSPGINHVVTALTVCSGELIAGGTFTTAGSSVCNDIARWTGSTWQPMGSGLGSGPPSPGVLALTVYAGEPIACGYFFANGADKIARWDGAAWQPLGQGISAVVLNTSAVYDGELIVGGAFQSGIARWNGSVWSSLGAGMFADQHSLPHVRALTVYNDNLVASGRFTAAGGVPCNNIARWNGIAWLPLASGILTGAYDGVCALTVYGDDLIAGGDFAVAGGAACSNIARWDGSAWRSLGSGTDGVVRALCAYSGELIAAGEFTNAGGVACNGIARWNGSAWQPLRSGMGGRSNSAYALTVYDAELIVGGNFTTADGLPSCFWARWGCTCPADFNNDATLNSQDFFDFLTALLAGDPTADFNTDGVANSQDFFDFLTPFFAGCA